MFEPLNPRLFKALQRVFGHVEIANQGERYLASPRPSMYRKGRRESPPAIAGEYLRVNCCHCDDTRKRLWVNHMWGVRDSETGDDHLYLIHCFNESCFNTRYRQEELFERLFPFNYNARMQLNDLAPAATSRTPAAKPPAVPATLPAPLNPLTNPISLAAQQYLFDRGFDPAELMASWQVSYCFQSPGSAPQIYDRIVIPVYAVIPRLSQEPVLTLAGWQARLIGEGHDLAAKYLTMKGMRKSHLLYGLPEACQTSGPLIVVEGVTDVWRLGTNAVGTFGKSISHEQINLMLRHFRGRTIGVMYDADAAAECQAAAARIREERHKWNDRSPVVVIPVPPGRGDVGDCTAAEAWAAIMQALPGGFSVGST